MNVIIGTGGGRRAARQCIIVPCLVLRQAQHVQGWPTAALQMSLWQAAVRHTCGRDVGADADVAGAEEPGHLPLAHPTADGRHAGPKVHLMPLPRLYSPPFQLHVPTEAASSKLSQADGRKYRKEGEAAGLQMPLDTGAAALLSHQAGHAVCLSVSCFLA